MGSDRKSKDKKSKKRSSPSPDSQDEGRSKRQRRGGEEEERKGKKSDKKSHKHSSNKVIASEKKSKDKHKSKHHKGDRKSKQEFQELSNDDYFAKNNEFATWLKEEKDVFFSELSSDSARELFADFVKAWNSQKLESRYYEGIASGPRSAHSWKFKK